MMLGSDAHIVIVGGGFSGTLLAANLVRFDGPRVTLIERRAELMAGGIAYGAAQPGQILNVRAGGMSAFPDDPGHFARWADAAGIAGAQAFVERRVYGRYLRETLDEAMAMAAGRLVLVEGEVCDWRVNVVTLADGRRIAADAVVLAVGNLPPHTPPGIDPSALPAGCFVDDPWSPKATSDLSPDDTVLLVGTGLTAVDVALNLDRDFAGRIVAVSRRGLVPRRHIDGTPPPPGLREMPRGTLSRLVGTVRTRAEAIGWRGAVDELRPVTQRLWATSDTVVQARFLRHLRPFWDVHRHRLAPAIADRIDGLIEGGRLSVSGGKIASVEASGAGARVTWRPRHATAAETLDVARIINCTGPQGDLMRTQEPLLRTLADRGAMRPDALRLGIDADAQSRVVAADGRVQTALYCIGPMTRGGLWEVVAVPDLRRQAWALARRLANAQWVGGEGL